MGVGKTSVARECGRLLRDVDVAHAVIDGPWLSDSWPRPADDPWNGRLAFKNLSTLWRAFRDAGATRLVYAGTTLLPADLDTLELAIPDAEITVIRLRAPVEVVKERLILREPPAAAEPYLDKAEHAVRTFDECDIQDWVIETGSVSVTHIAMLALQFAGWY
jgi:adenylylsulfate kinase